jgi:hypothetical protein
VIAFQSEGHLQSAVDLLKAQGFGASYLTRYTPPEMMAQVDAELADPSPIASLGHELDFIRAHRVLAERGNSFWVVHAPDSDQVGRVTQVERDTHAVRAQRYGLLVIEELIDQPLGAEAGSQ